MKQYLFSRCSGGLGIIVASLTLALLPAASAQAALISTGACNDSALSQPFVPWGDSSSYELAPGGSFGSSLSGWTVKGGAGLVPGGEPYGVTGSVSKSSIYLPAGSSAQSPYTCVNAAYPTIRFFARNTGLLSTVVVQVVYNLPLLGPVAIPVGPVALSGTWQPTLPMLTASAIPGLLTGGTAQVALRFTALTGNSEIDDVFIDPRMH
jgi:hypothetical protein